MGCSHRKLSETGLRIVGTFLKVKLCVGARGSTGSGASITDDNRICVVSDETTETAVSDMHINMHIEDMHWKCIGKCFPHHNLG